MKVRVVTMSGEEQEFEIDPHGALGRLEFPTLGGDPELPQRFWLNEIAKLEVSEHPAPVTQTPQAPRLVERELDVSTYAFTHEQPGERVRVGPRRVVKINAPAQDDPPASKRKKGAR
jgi:hypothetical protein